MPSVWMTWYGYFYPRPPRGGRLQPPEAGGAAVVISIHALREEGDNGFCDIGLLFRIFLSTPSARRATRTRMSVLVVYQNFYPRPPRGGRLEATLDGLTQYDFYPRPPRGGRRVPGRGQSLGKRFLSTPSARRATSCPHSRLQRLGISIHALREEGDIK